MHLHEPGCVQAIEELSSTGVQGLAIRGQVVDVVQRRDHLGVIEYPVGLECAVHDGHGDGRIATSQQAITESTDSVEHQAAFQRRWY